ncbi:hypothetical protein HDU97_001831 [Phlyctochytrium planicorne]|nr:hypothetical protein HDU97_001831 [Phlyctochytrium planicorne]
MEFEEWETLFNDPHVCKDYVIAQICLDNDLWLASVDPQANPGERCKLKHSTKLYEELQKVTDNDCIELRNSFALILREKLEKHIAEADKRIEELKRICKKKSAPAEINQWVAALNAEMREKIAILKEWIKNGELRKFQRGREHLEVLRTERNEYMKEIMNPADSSPEQTLLDVCTVCGEFISKLDANHPDIVEYHHNTKRHEKWQYARELVR